MTLEIREALQFARYAKRGIWPIDGGALDQTPWCMEAFEQIWSEQQYWRKTLRRE